MKLVRAINNRVFVLKDLMRECEYSQQCFICNNYEEILDFFQALRNVGYCKWRTTITIEDKEPANDKYDINNPIPVAYFIHSDGLTYSYNTDRRDKIQWRKGMIIIKEI